MASTRTPIRGRSCLGALLATWMRAPSRRRSWAVARWRCMHGRRFGCGVGRGRDWRRPHEGRVGRRRVFFRRRRRQQGIGSFACSLVSEWGVGAGSRSGGWTSWCGRRHWRSRHTGRSPRRWSDRHSVPDRRPFRRDRLHKGERRRRPDHRLGRFQSLDHSRGVGRRGAGRRQPAGNGWPIPKGAFQARRGRQRWQAHHGRWPGRPAACGAPTRRVAAEGAGAAAARARARRWLQRAVVLPGSALAATTVGDRKLAGSACAATAFACAQNRGALENSWEYEDDRDDLSGQPTIEPTFPSMKAGWALDGSPRSTTSYAWPMLRAGQTVPSSCT